MSNCTLYISSTVLTLHTALMTPTFILGLLGNIYVLLMFCRRPRTEWTYMMVYITNMSISDCVLLTILPVRMYYYNIPLGDSWKQVCNFLLLVYYVNMYVSIFTVTAISVVRYVAIKYPMKARVVFSCRRALVVCALIWLLIGAVSPIYFLKDSQNDKSMCFQRVRETLSLQFVLLLVIVGFLVPFLVMLYCSVRVVHTLHKQLDMGSRSEKIQCIFIILANLTVFVVCFLPVHLGYLFKFVVQMDNYSCVTKLHAHNFLHVAFCMSSMNCCLDCFSYFFATKQSWNLKCMRSTSPERYKCQEQLSPGSSPM